MNKWEINWAIRKSQEGYSLKEIAEALYVSPTKISNEFKKRGYNLNDWKPKKLKPTKKLHYDGLHGEFTKRPKSRRLTDAEVFWAMDRSKEGYTQKEIAEALGTSQNQISVRFLEKGYYSNARTRKYKDLPPLKFNFKSTN